MQNKKRTSADNKRWLFHFQFCVFLFGDLTTEFQAARKNLPFERLSEAALLSESVSPVLVCHRSVKQRADEHQFPFKFWYLRLYPSLTQTN